MKTVNLTDYILVIISLLLLCYTGLRAHWLSFTHDESYTFLVHMQLSIKDIFLYNGACPANNHLLYTLLMKPFSFVAGDSELVLRLPSLLGHVLYLASTALIARKFKSWVLIICSYLLLNLNPFVLEFFSLARGYGLALGFMLLSIYFLIKNFDKKEIEGNNILLTTLPAALSVLSNFTFLNFYLALIGVLLIINEYKFFVLQKRNLTFKTSLNFALRKNLYLVIITLILAGTIAYPIMKLRRDEQLYYGGDKGFWQDTVISLIKGTLYGQDYVEGTETIIGIFIIVTLITSTTLFTCQAFKQKLKLRGLVPLGILFIILLSALSTIIQYYALDTKFLINRTAILFIPLFSLMLIFIFKPLYSHGNVIARTVTLLSLIAMTGLSTLHLANVANASHTYSWQDQASTKDIMLYLRSMYDETHSRDEKITLATNGVHVPSLDYYKKTLDLPWLEFDHQWPQKEKVFDYYYCSQKEQKLIKNGNITVVSEYPVSDHVLLKDTTN